MHRFLLAILIATSSLASFACKPADPNSFATHTKNIRDQKHRSQGLEGLESLVKTITSSQDEEVRNRRLQEFVDQVIPVFAEVWSEAAPEHRTKMLIILRDAGRPEAAQIWNQAFSLDGSEEARNQFLTAIQGIVAADAKESAGALAEQLKKLIQDPSYDQEGARAGELRMELANALGEVGGASAVDVLIEATKQPKDRQPVIVHRAAATALGEIGDAKAVDPLLEVTFRVPDTLSTTDIGNRSKLALLQIGKPSIARTIAMFKGEHEGVNKVVEEVNAKLLKQDQNPIEPLTIQQTAVGILGALGDPQATDDLLALMPKDDCGAAATKAKDEEPDPEAVSLRAFIANALGSIGDPKASEPLCSCVNATHNPGDMYEIVVALGRIADEKAFACLIDTVTNGSYDEEVVASPEFIHQIRWEAGRYAILAAKSSDVEEVKKAFAANEKDAKVSQELKKWDAGLQLLERCQEDKSCYLKSLADQNADWFEREKAAVEVARRSPGDEKAALEIAKAFKVRSPDARVTMALYVDRALQGKKCPECADALNAVLEGEKISRSANMQLPVLTARATIAKVQ